MKSNIFIPKKIKVGFQERSDTFTKRLAYVIIGTLEYLFEQLKPQYKKEYLLNGKERI
jgi:hypothetical protein